MVSISAKYFGPFGFCVGDVTELLVEATIPVKEGDVNKKRQRSTLLRCPAPCTRTLYTKERRKRIKK